VLLLPRLNYLRRASAIMVLPRFFDAGAGGCYLSSKVLGTYSRHLDLVSYDAYMNTYYRANGFAVRCLKH